MPPPFWVLTLIILSCHNHAASGAAVKGTTNGAKPPAPPGGRNVRKRAKPVIDTDLEASFYTFRNRIGKVSQIGRGSYGAVYSAQLKCTEAANNMVAVKVQNFRQPSRGHTFEAEAKVMRLHRSLPYFVQYFAEARVMNTDTNCGAHAIIMEKAHGGDLSSALQSESWQRVPPATLARLIVELLRGVNAMHDNEYVHGDLKAGNILLSQSCLNTIDPCQIRIADMGFACKPINSATLDAGDTADVQCNGVAGTPTHMAPELDAIDVRSRPEKNVFWRQDVATLLKQDVFSAGLVIWQILFGRLPHFIRKSKTLSTLINQKIEFCNQVEAQMDAANMPSILTRMMVGMLKEDPRERASVKQSLDLAVQFLREIDGYEIASPNIPRMPSCWKVCFEYHRGCTDTCVAEEGQPTPSQCTRHPDPYKSQGIKIAERFSSVLLRVPSAQTAPIVVASESDARQATITEYRPTLQELLELEKNGKTLTVPSPSEVKDLQNPPPPPSIAHTTTDTLAPEPPPPTQPEEKNELQATSSSTDFSDDDDSGNGASGELVEDGGTGFIQLDDFGDFWDAIPLDDGMRQRDVDEETSTRSLAIVDNYGEDADDSDEIRLWGLQRQFLAEP